MPLLPALNPPLADWRGRRAWIVGASTGIGRAVAALLHERGAQVTVSARDEAALAAFAAAHPGARALRVDVTDAARMREAWDEVAREGTPDLVLYCAGYYKPTQALAFDLAEMLRHDAVNYGGALHLLDACLPALVREGRGHLSLVSSVAGYRGLPRSLGYGPTKAALSNLAQALYLDLHPRGIGISLVSPGFVATPLTAQNEFRMPALITPEEAAQAMLDGWARGLFELHFPRRFTWVMKALSLLPFRLYQRLVRSATGNA
ncbi:MULTISPECIES: SDR family NAD(P)-dependent oxidoreductase [Ramlibacter]|uniref:SDR family NAD(P)-dependent oxidoreductase n=1 Tax=Ramlibacter aquaticus TaxID=2780094 RepID=A0ABR9SIK3_9BURK|nr:MULTISPECIES: SDR family NAD(P)-dependent oxidoreductase [Ramlibacter]MBE7942206.1 SDR family NAD(P)-dependent oxidoreductase [Ramlibacter aquaticus]